MLLTIVLLTYEHHRYQAMGIVRTDGLVSQVDRQPTAYLNKQRVHRLDDNGCVKYNLRYSRLGYLATAYPYTTERLLPHPRKAAGAQITQS